LSNLDLVLSFLPDPSEWHRETTERLRQSFTGAGLVAVWEVQSQLATVALVGLLATVSVVPALVIMLCWSFIACAAYCYTRRNGMPDLLEAHRASSERGTRRRLSLVGTAGMAVVKAWLAGVQPFVYSRTVCRLLSKPVTGWRVRVVRSAVLLVGLTLFGVTTAHHMLRRAGYSERRIFQLSLAGSFLNVPYRIVLSAAVLNLLTNAVRLPI
jgi:hypothetical protein